MASLSVWASLSFHEDSYGPTAAYRLIFSCARFIQKATGQEDLVQSCDAPLQRGLVGQRCGTWNPSTATAVPLSHSTHTHTYVYANTHHEGSVVFLPSDIHTALFLTFDQCLLPHGLSRSHTHAFTVMHCTSLFHVQKYTFLILSSHIFYIRYNSLTRKKVNYCTIWSNHLRSNCSCNMRSTFSVLF